MEKNILVIIKSSPVTNLNYYEALRTAAGLWDHMVTVLWIGKGVHGAVDNIDKSLTDRFLTDLPELDIDLFVETESLFSSGLDEEDLIESVELADPDKVLELIGEAEVTLVY